MTFVESVLALKFSTQKMTKGRRNAVWAVY